MAKPQKALRRRHQASGAKPAKRAKLLAPADLGTDKQGFLDSDSDAENAHRDLGPEKPSETPAEARLRLGESMHCCEKLQVVQVQ